MTILDEAKRVEISPLVHYDEITMRRIIAELLVFIAVERRRHEEELKEARRELY